jgi:hypothetical protein
MIDSNIPIPIEGGRNGTTNIMRSLKIGDSFISFSDRTNLAKFAKRAGIKITTRITHEGQRVWRTA